MSTWSNGVKGQTKRTTFHSYSSWTITIFNDSRTNTLQLFILLGFASNGGWSKYRADFFSWQALIRFKLHLGLCPCIQMLKVKEMSKKNLESDKKLVMLPPEKEKWSFTGHWLFGDALKVSTKFQQWMVCGKDLRSWWWGQNVPSAE